MRVFWQQGYEHTSIRDLERATGLNASSLYNTWGGKEALFRQVLDYYVEGIVQRRIETYLQEGDPIAGIRRFFETTYDYIDTDTPPLACLLTNTAQALGHHDERIREQLDAGMQRVEAGFQAALERLDEPRPAGQTPAVLARNLALSLQGLLVISRVSPDRERLQALTDAALAPLENLLIETTVTK
jgi:TetR/AcrR family transcriptional repressor of nem operon